MDINSNNRRYYYNLVPIALELYLFPFRTQKSSPVAPIILLCGKLGRCQIMKNPPERVVFSMSTKKNPDQGSFLLGITPQTLREQRGGSPQRFAFSSLGRT